MTLILAEPVPNLGIRGDVVQVKHGYGRNFLLPKGKAVYAHHLNCKKFGIADIKEKLNEKGERKQLDDMAVIVKKFMQKKRLVIEQDPLVSDWMIREPHIATALRIQHHLHVPLDYVIIDKPITQFGETKVAIVISEKEEDVGRGVGNAIEEGGSDKVALTGGNGGEIMVANGRLCISVPVIVKEKELKTEENDNNF